MIHFAFTSLVFPVSPFLYNNSRIIDLPIYLVKKKNPQFSYQSNPLIKKYIVKFHFYFYI